MSHVYEQKILQQKVKLSEFLAHRIARLWPLHVFAMLTVLVVELGHGYLSPRQDALNWDSAVYTFFLNLTLLQNAGLFFGRDGGATWDGNGWSLTPEVVLNLLWFYWLAKRRLSSGLLVVVVLVCAVVQFNFGGQLNGTILSSRIVAATIPYGIGCLVYRHFLQREAWQILSPRLWNVLGVFTFLLAVAALAGGGGGQVFRQLYLAQLGLASGSVCLSRADRHCPYRGNAAQPVLQLATPRLPRLHLLFRLFDAISGRQAVRAASALVYGTRDPSLAGCDLPGHSVHRLLFHLLVGRNTHPEVSSQTTGSPIRASL